MTFTDLQIGRGQGLAKGVARRSKEAAEKSGFFRMLKNAKVQGARNPEE
jgi:hypothetical protein